MAGSGKIFRIFLSSTFRDFKEERNLIRSEVFEPLRAECQAHGADLQIVDLRWGISTAAARSRDTMRICLSEITRSRRLSPRPNFVCLVGDRYGWQPAPSDIGADTFADLLNHLPPDDAAVLNEVYRLDHNRLTQSQDGACLVPTYGFEPAALVSGTALPDQRVHAIIAKAVRDWADIPMPIKVRLCGAATEQEIWHGLLSDDEAAAHTFAILRSVATPPSPVASLSAHALDFFDTTKGGALDENAYKQVQGLKRQIAAHLGPNALQTTLHLTENRGTTEARIENRVALPRLRELLWSTIEPEIPTKGSRRNRSAAQPEQGSPAAAQAAGRGVLEPDTFVGRTEQLAELRALPEGSVCVVTGPGGVGKSALLAKAACDMGEAGNATVVHLALGVSEQASSGAAALRVVLDALVQDHFPDLTVRHGRPGLEDLREALATAATDDAAAAALLHRLLATPLDASRTDVPLSVILDGVDQLPEGDLLRQLSWLPRPVRARVRLILSVRDETLDVLNALRHPAVTRLHLSGFGADEGERLLNVWCRKEHRALTPSQRAAVLQAFRPGDTPGLPLVLRLAFEHARHWSERTLPPVLPTSARELARSFLDNLAHDERHGRIFTTTAVALLAAARSGLNETELTRALWRSEAIQSECRSRFPDSPPFEGLPDIIWSRLFWDLEPFLAEAAGEPGRMRFFHREVADAARAWAVEADCLTAAHRLLADLFGEEPPLIKGNGRETGNLRRLDELPYHLHALGRTESLEQVLTDLDTVQAAAERDVLPKLVADMATFAHEATAGLRAFIIANTSDLARSPALTRAIAANEPTSSPAYAAALRGGLPVPRLDLLDRDLRGGDVRIVLASPVVLRTWDPTRESLLIIQENGSVELWRSHTGEIRTLATLTDPVRGGYAVWDQDHIVIHARHEAHASPGGAARLSGDEPLNDRATSDRPDPTEFSRIYVLDPSTGQVRCWPASQSLDVRNQASPEARDCRLTPAGIYVGYGPDLIFFAHGTTAPQCIERDVRAWDVTPDGEIFGVIGAVSARKRSIRTPEPVLATSDLSASASKPVRLHLSPDGRHGVAIWMDEDTEDDGDYQHSVDFTVVVPVFVETPLPENAALVCNVAAHTPGWDPTGRFFCFPNRTDDSLILIVGQLEGGLIKRVVLTLRGEWYTDWRWSPDGTAIRARREDTGPSGNDTIRRTVEIAIPPAVFEILDATDNSTDDAWPGLDAVETEIVGQAPMRDAVVDRTLGKSVWISRPGSVGPAVIDVTLETDLRSLTSHGLRVATFQDPGTASVVDDWTHDHDRDFDHTFIGTATPSGPPAVFSPDGRHAAASGTYRQEQGINVWWLEGGTLRPLDFFAGRPEWSALGLLGAEQVRLVAGSTDGQLAGAQAWPQPGRPERTGLRRLQPKAPLALIPHRQAHRGPIVQLAAARASTRFASVGADRTIKVWDWPFEADLSLIHDVPASAWPSGAAPVKAQFSPSGHCLAVGLSNGMLAVLPLGSTPQIWRDQQLIDAAMVTALAWASEDTLVVAHDTGILNVVAAHTGCVELQWPLPAPATCLATHDGGNVIAVGTERGMLRFVRPAIDSTSTHAGDSDASTTAA